MICVSFLCYFLNIYFWSEAKPSLILSLRRQGNTFELISSAQFRSVRRRSPRLPVYVVPWRHWLSLSMTSFVTWRWLLQRCSPVGDWLTAGATCISREELTQLTEARDLWRYVGICHLQDILACCVSLDEVDIVILLRVLQNRTQAKPKLIWLYDYNNGQNRTTLHLCLYWLPGSVNE